MTTASYDIALDDPGLLVEVDWDRDETWDHPRSDMAAYWSRGDYQFGSSRRSNPQRPAIAPGAGRLVVAGDDFVPGRSTVFTPVQLQQRHRCRMTLDCDLDNPGTMREVLFEAWLEAPRHRGSEGTGGVLSTFELEGYLERSSREIQMIAQTAAATTASASAVLELLRDAFGLEAADFTADVDATPLSLYSFDGPAAQYASRFAAVSGGLPCARRAGQLRLQDPSNRPATIPVFSNSEYVITKATTEFDIEQLWNIIEGDYQPRANYSAAVTRSLAPTNRRYTPSTSALANSPGATTTVTNVYTLPDLPAGSSYRDLSATVTVNSLRVRSDHFSIDSPYSRISSIAGGRSGTVASLPIWTVGSVTRNSDGSVDVELNGTNQSGNVTGPLQPSSDGTNTITIGSGWWTRYFGNQLFYKSISYTITLSWVVESPEQTLVARNDDSVEEWDPRKLVFDDPWFAATAQTALQARLADLAEPRDIVTVDFALRQPTAVRTRDVARIQPGDHIGVYIDEPGEELDINSAVMVMNVAYRPARNRLSTKRLVCIGAGAIAVTKPPTLAAPTVVALSRSEIRATWAAPADDGAGALDGYRARWRRLNAGQWRIVDDIAGLTVDVAGLAPSTEYEVQVAAVRGGVSGDWSPSGTATTLAASRPARMAAPTVVQGPLNTQLDVSWVAPDDGGSAITHYDSRRRLSPSGAWVETRDISGNLRTSRVSRLEVDTAYDFQIRAANAIGDGEWSPTATQSTAERVVRRGSAQAVALEVRAPQPTGRRVVIVRTGSGQAVAITIGAAEATGRDVAIVRTGSGQAVVIEVGAAEASGVIPQPAEGQAVALEVTVVRATGRSLIGRGAGQAVALEVDAGEATGLAARRGYGQPVVIEVTASRATAEGHTVPVGGIQLEGIPLTLDQRYIVLTDPEEES